MNFYLKMNFILNFYIFSLYFFKISFELIPMYSFNVGQYETIVDVIELNNKTFNMCICIFL